LTRNFLLPDYVAYANTAAASLFPTNASVADLAHEQQGLVGYVHPFDTYPDPAKDTLTNELPVDVALGKVDYIEGLGFADHKSTAKVWYQLLNCGFHLPPQRVPMRWPTSPPCVDQWDSIGFTLKCQMDRSTLNRG